MTKHRSQSGNRHGEDVYRVTGDTDFLRCEVNMPPIPIRPRPRRQQNTAVRCTKEGVDVPFVNHGASVASLSSCACADVVNDADVCAVKYD